MDQESVNTIIKFLSDHLKKDGVPIEQIILFGSGSKNQMNPDSDLDIAIISPAFNGKTIFEKTGCDLAESWYHESSNGIT